MKKIVRILNKRLRDSNIQQWIRYSKIQKLLRFSNIQFRLSVFFIVLLVFSLTITSLLAINNPATPYSLK